MVGGGVGLLYGDMVVVTLGCLPWHWFTCCGIGLLAAGI